MKNKKNLVEVCAFVALVLSAVLYLVNLILGLIPGASLGLLGSILSMIASILMAVCVMFSGLAYVKGKGLLYNVILWVALVIYVISVVIPIFLG